MPAKPSKKTVSVVSSKAAANPVANALQGVLKDTYALYLATHNYHWNVEGPNFVGLHTLFEQQYTELFAAIDVLAERIRALDVYALPNHYDEVLKSLQNLSNPLNKASDGNAIAERMVENLLALNAKVVEAAQAAKKLAEKTGDDETQDLMVERVQVHQKASWMLRSLIK
ncbi:MAG: DNA starvation/stationary phase protection protein [Rickettsiales bacterium]|nr:DNA starvation/stationary phase protection protein [Rickettsiales bacterium]